MLLSMMFFLAAGANGGFHFDSTWVVAIAGAIGSCGWIASWFNERRKLKLKAKIGAEEALAVAYTTGAKGFETLINNLREEVTRLQDQVWTLKKQLEAAQAQLGDVRADLTINVTENRRLRGELRRMSNALAAFDKPNPNLPT